MQTLVGGCVVLLGLALGFGAMGIPSDSGYGGAGPNFLPWVVSIALVICGAVVVYEARTGGYRNMDPPSGDDTPYWPGFAWISAGLLLNAALITTIGFIFSCTLCFALAVEGMRRSEGQGGLSPAGWAKTVAIGLAISAPVFWMFTQFLAINLPGLTKTGWL